jgi:four helix bundle protein
MQSTKLKVQNCSLQFKIMDNINDFKKKLIQRAVYLSKGTIKLVDKFSNKRSALVIFDQLLKAVTSIGANIIEAQAASSKRDFVNFLNQALKSRNETKFWFDLAKDIAPEQKELIESLKRNR